MISTGGLSEGEVEAAIHEADFAAWKVKWKKRSMSEVHAKLLHVGEQLAKTEARLAIETGDDEAKTLFASKDLRALAVSKLMERASKLKLESTFLLSCIADMRARGTDMTEAEIKAASKTTTVPMRHKSPPPRTKGNRNGPAKPRSAGGRVRQPVKPKGSEDAESKEHRVGSAVPARAMKASNVKGPGLSSSEYVSDGLAQAAESPPASSVAVASRDQAELEELRSLGVGSHRDSHRNSFAKPAPAPQRPQEMGVFPVHVLHAA